MEADSDAVLQTPQWSKTAPYSWLPVTARDNRQGVVRWKIGVHSASQSGACKQCIRPEQNAGL